MTLNNRLSSLERCAAPVEPICRVVRLPLETLRADAKTHAQAIHKASKGAKGPLIVAPEAMDLETWVKAARRCMDQNAGGGAL